MLTPEQLRRVKVSPTPGSHPPPPARVAQVGHVLSIIYLFLIIVEVIVNLKCKPESVEKVRCAACAGRGVGGGFYSQRRQ